MDATPGSLPSQKGVAPGWVMPSMESYHLPVPAGMRPAPMFAPGQMQGRASNRVNIGTVLTGHIEDDLSSNKNKVGDIFSIRLEEGFVTSNGEEVIPKQSKIVGIITGATAARAQHNGMPGKIDVSLQTLVFPDGRSTSFAGFIAHNPSMDVKEKGSPSVLSGPMGAMTTGFTSIFTALNSKAGIPLRMPKRTGGLDFKLDKGELLPVKLNRTLDLSHMTPAPPGLAAATGFGQPGPNGFGQSGPNGFGQPGPNGFGQPGPNGFGQPGPNGFAQPGPNGFGQPGLNGFGQPGPNGYPSQWPSATAPAAMPGWVTPAPNTVTGPSFAPSIAKAPLLVPERATAGLLPGLSTPQTSVSNMPDPF